MAAHKQEKLGHLEANIMVIVLGSGGLGCEILKNLVMNGFKTIHLVDMDTVELSNLNRQFLFTAKDVGKPKVKVAADFINRQFAHFGVRVFPHYCKIQSLEVSFYSQFSLIFGGLDNVESRRWINSLIHSMVDYINSDGIRVQKVIPFLDGGVEGFMGQARVIIPGTTSCYECSLSSLPLEENFPICTIANYPRLPEHCIVHSMLVEWPRTYNGVDLKNDDEEHISLIYEMAKRRAANYSLEGVVTVDLVRSVMKRIIPAVGTTNAIIAASLVNEGLKLKFPHKFSGNVLNNYFMYIGNEGINTLSFKYEDEEGCLVCKQKSINLQVSREDTLRLVLEKVWLHFSTGNSQVWQPSVINDRKGLILLQNPKVLRKQYEHRLDYSIEKLLLEGLIRENEALHVRNHGTNWLARLNLLFR